MENKFIKKPKICIKCGDHFHSKIWHKKHCDKCLNAPKICQECKEIYFTTNMRSKFCSRSCSSKNRIGKKLSKESIEKTKEGLKRYWENNPEKYKEFRKRASIRMKTNNPMSNIEYIKKANTTKKERNILNTLLAERGGNGKFTKPQILIADLLGSKWTKELIVRTNTKRGSGYPSHYKIDIGRNDLKIGIEIDGSSHNSKKIKILDRKKEVFLNSIGWNILRFKNKEVLENPELIKRAILSYVKFIKNLKNSI